MKLNIKNLIDKYDIRLVIFDIDGTIKNLHEEHLIGLERAFRELGIYSYKRTKFALWLNSVGMYFFKLGCLPTNVKMQKILLYIMSIVTFTKYATLKNVYYRYFPKNPILFHNMAEQILSIPKTVKVVFTSTNHYTMNAKKKLCNIFCVDEPSKKIYKKIIESYEVKPFNTLIVGDNLFDDYIPAKMLGAKVNIVNMYNLRVKEKIINILSTNK